MGAFVRLERQMESDSFTRQTAADGATAPGEAGHTRANVAAMGIAAGGALVAGGILFGGLPRPAVSQPSAAQNERVLTWLLQVQQLEAGFYTEVERHGALSGELRELSKRVGEQERAHVSTLERALGGSQSKAPTFDFGDATRDPQRFLAAAMDLEELALAAVNGQVPNLTKKRIVITMGIASVEARHVGWVRDLAGRNPAPRPADQPATQAQTEAAIKDTGFMA
jgi:hypothetical protein